MTTYDSLHSLLDYECPLFSLSSTVTDLVLIYESVTSSASVVQRLTFHSWTLSHDSRPLLRMNDDSESESQLFSDWRFTANHLVLATSPLRLTTQ
jgi:hypothetical protein